ncbi:MAG: 50S ribosomal protein L9 [Chloroflexota bacterium]
MKVILLDYVYKQGVAGEVIDVADGFARNYLIPKGLAVQATEGELKRAAKLREQAAAKRAALDQRMNELARMIDGVELIFGRRAATTGKLFGSVTTQEIADELMEKTGVDINRRRISQQSLRELGTHEVPVRLGSEISPTLKVTIVRDDELADFLAQREAAANAEEGEAEAEGEAGPGEEEVSEPAHEEMETEVMPASAVREALEQMNQQGEAAETTETETPDEDNT